jgi:hypothetical protein
LHAPRLSSNPGKGNGPLAARAALRQVGPPL